MSPLRTTVHSLQASPSVGSGSGSQSASISGREVTVVGEQCSELKALGLVHRITLARPSSCAMSRTSVASSGRKPWKRNDSCEASARRRTRAAPPGRRPGGWCTPTGPGRRPPHLPRGGLRGAAPCSACVDARRRTVRHDSWRAPLGGGGMTGTEAGSSCGQAQSRGHATGAPHRRCGCHQRSGGHCQDHSAQRQ